MRAFSGITACADEGDNLSLWPSPLRGTRELCRATGSTLHARKAERFRVDDSIGGTPADAVGTTALPGKPLMIGVRLFIVGWRLTGGAA